MGCRLGDRLAREGHICARLVQNFPLSRSSRNSDNGDGEPIREQTDVCAASALSALGEQSSALQWRRSLANNDRGEVFREPTR